MAVSLSFDKEDGGDAIAVVRGGDMEGEILYLHCNNKSMKPSRFMDKDINTQKYSKMLSHLKPAARTITLRKMVDAIEHEREIEGLEGLDDITKGVFARMKLDKENDKSIELPMESMFHPIPSADPKKRQVYYVAGASGAGKSFFAIGIAESYKKLYPDREIYLISELQQDDTLDTMKIGKPKRISLQSLVDEPLDLEECRNCLILVDDFDVLKKPFSTAVFKLIDSIVTMGRHTNTSILIMSHFLTNYKTTRLWLSEAQYIVLYPQACSAKGMTYLLENYGGMDREQIKPLKKLGRWVMLAKNYPSYILSAHNAYLLHQ